MSYTHQSRYQAVSKMTVSGYTQAKELQKAARNGNVRLVRQLIAQGALPDARDVDGWTCLHAAAVEGHENVVRELCGEDTTAAKQGSDSTTSATVSSQNAVELEEDGDVGEELMDLNIATACGRTALYFAAMIGSIECVRVLLHHGADPCISCNEGKAPLDVAALFDRSEVQKLLQAAIDCPRPPIKRRPKRAATKKAGSSSDADEQKAPVHVYNPPEPSQWRKSDFSKWSNITDKDLDAIDAHQERAAQQAQRERKAAAPTPAPTSDTAPATAGRTNHLPYGNGRIGPPKTLPPSHPRYQDYKEWMDIQEDVKRAQRGEGNSGEKDRLLSFKPPSEGGVAPDKDNGCHGMGYTWGQTPTEVQVWIVVAAGTSKNDIACNISPSSLTVAVCRVGGSDGGGGRVRRNTIFKDARLWKRVKAEESVWTLEEGLLTLTLRKGEAGWWRCVTDLEGHTKIDSSLCRGPDMLDEYEESEQAQLRQFFHRQLSRGL